MSRFTSKGGGGGDVSKIQPLSVTPVIYDELTGEYSLAIADITDSPADAIYLGDIADLPSSLDNDLLVDNLDYAVDVSALGILDDQGAPLVEGINYYLSPTVPGGFTRVKPSSPDLIQKAFYVDTDGNLMINLDAAIDSLSGTGGDADWYTIGGTEQPLSINDDIYTLGKVSVNSQSNYEFLNVSGRVWISSSLAPLGVGTFVTGNEATSGILIFDSGRLNINGVLSNANLSLAKNGTTGQLATFFVDGAAVGDIFTDGVTTSYNTSSDRRLKENIKPTEKTINDLMKIEVVDHGWRSSGEKDTGFIAQDLHEVFGKAVTKGSDEVDAGGNLISPWKVDNSKLVPLLVKSIQDNQLEISALQKKTTQLELKIKSILERT